MRQVRQPRPAGYTLAEMMVVVLIVAAVAVVAVPALMAPLAEARLSGAVNEVARALEFARRTVISSGRQTRVTVDAAADTILVEQFENGFDLLGSESVLNEGVVEGGSFVPMEHPLNRSLPYSVSFTAQERFRGVEITAVNFGGGSSVIFDTLGIPSSGGSVKLASDTHEVIVTVSPVTGAVSMSD
jgi:prepilin-type N-terminal cleavage/methylation domain-containing protein